MRVILDKFIEKANEYRKLTDFENVLFALPFTLAGMLLAYKNGFPSIKTTFIVVMVFLAGWIGALTANRLIDSKIDAKNPRTSDRAIPRGRIKKTTALGIIIISFLIMLFGVLQLPSICIKLLPLAFLALIAYPFVKRFSWMCHVVLGLTLGASAAGGWIAMTGAVTLPITLWAFASAFWVAGFDVIYGTLDYDFDRENNVYSIPARFGIEKSLKISKLFHFISFLCFLGVGLVHNVNLFYYLAVAFVGCMLVYEHYLCKQNKIMEAFFNANAIMGTGILILVILGKIL